MKFFHDRGVSSINSRITFTIAAVIPEVTIGLGEFDRKSLHRRGYLISIGAFSRINVFSTVAFVATLGGDLFKKTK